MLDTVLSQISHRFYLPHEFPFLSIKEEAEEAAQLVINHRANEYSLTVRQVDSLIFALSLYQSDEIVNVLKKRMTKRLFKLLWAYFQYHHKDEQILHVLYDGLPLGYSSLHNSDFINNPDEYLASNMLTYSILCEEFFGSYNIMEGSPLWQDILASYFMKCTDNDYINNKNSLNAYLKTTQSMPIASRYVLCLSVSGFDRDVMSVICNIKLTDKPLAVVKKWSFQNTVKLFLPPSHYKAVLPFEDYIRDVNLNEDILTICFGNFFLIYSEGLFSLGFIYCRGLYKDTDDFMKNYLSFSQKNHLRNSKDFILYKIHDEYMKMSIEPFEEIYTAEMLNTLV